MQDPLKIGSTIGKGSFLWYGIAGTWFWIDPVYELIVVGMIQQRSDDMPELREVSYPLIYQAIVEE